MCRRIPGQYALLFFFSVLTDTVYAGVMPVETEPDRDSLRNERRSDAGFNINVLSRAALADLGILTKFQIESLLEYRETYGDILSATELSTVDGFDDELVREISSQLLFEPSPPEGRTAKNVFTARLRKPYSKSGLTQTYKYQFSWRELSAAVVADNDPGEKFPDFVSAYVRYKGLTVGDFRSCYAQGLVLWKGMTMSSLGEPSLLLRRETGISGYTSSDEDSNLRGVAWTGDVAGHSLSALASYNGKMAAVNVCKEYGSSDIFKGRLRKNGTGKWKIGFTAASGHRNKDAGIWANGSMSVYGSVRHLRMFGEAAVNEKLAPAAKIGALWRPLYEFEMGGTAWLYAPAYTAPQGAPSIKDQAGVELSARYVRSHWKLNGNLQCSYKFTEASWKVKYRVAAQYVTDGGSSLYIQVRNAPSAADLSAAEFSSEKLPEYLLTKALARIGGAYVSGSWTFAARFEGNRAGWCIYGETSYKSARFQVSARVTAYNTDGWTSRVYVYERDVPQSFATLAYYGKGTGAYLYLQYTPVRWMNLCLKVQQNYCAFFTRIFIPG